MNNASLSLRDFNRLFPNEEAARAWFEDARWPNGTVCPGYDRVKSATCLAGVRRWQCRPRRRQFSVTVGTPLQRTRLPMVIRNGVGRTLPYRFLTGAA